MPPSSVRRTVTPIVERTERLIVGRRSIPFVVLAVILALVGVAAVLAVRQYNDSRDAAMNELHSRVVVAAATANAYFAGTVETLTSIAASQPVIEGNRPQMLAYFRRVAPPGNKVFTGGLGWIDATGQSRVSSARARLGRPVDVSDRTYFKSVRRDEARTSARGISAKQTRLRIVVSAVPTRTPRAR